RKVGTHPSTVKGLRLNTMTMSHGRLQARIAGLRRGASTTLLLATAIAAGPALVCSGLARPARAAVEVPETTPRPADALATGALPPGAAPDPAPDARRDAPAPRTTPSARNDPYRSPPSRPALAPSGFRDVTAWLEYKTRSHLLALPQEARIFYRQGL